MGFHTKNIDETLSVLESNSSKHSIVLSDDDISTLATTTRKLQNTNVQIN